MDNSDENTGGFDHTANRVEDRRASIEHWLETLAHASRCHDETCSTFLGCKKMKRVITHAAMCGRQPVEHVCAICKQLVALCCYHAKKCSEKICYVPDCSRIKKKLMMMTVTAVQRIHVADLLLETISSNTIDMVILGQEISSQASYAKKIENNIYHKSHSHTDYYRLLAAKKWEIEMDIEERLREQQEIDTVVRLYS